MKYNRATTLSLSRVYSLVERSTVGRTNLSLYSNLLRVGTSIIFASVALAAITLLLFAPSFPFLPFGRFTQVGLGIITSIVAFRLYKLLKVSNETLLDAKSTEDGQDEFSLQLTRTTLTRISFIIGFAILTVVIVWLGVSVFGGFFEATDYNAEGFLANISQELEFLLFFSVLIFETGIIINFVGNILVLWALLTPFRACASAVYRIKKLQLLIIGSTTLARLMGRAYTNKPSFLCDYCFDSTFKLVDRKPEDTSEYSLACTRCGNEYSLSESMDRPDYLKFEQINAN